MSKRINRRDVLKTTAAAGMGYWVAGRASWADELASKSPNERVNVASIGIGGKGDSDSDQCAKHANLIGICDIDDHRLDSKAKRYPRRKSSTIFGRCWTNWERILMPSPSPRPTLRMPSRR